MKILRLSQNLPKSYVKGLITIQALVLEYSGDCDHSFQV